MGLVFSPCQLDIFIRNSYKSLIKIHLKESGTLKKMKPFDLAHEQYQLLMTKFKNTKDLREKNILFRRLTNLLAVMEFLITIHKPH